MNNFLQKCLKLSDEISTPLLSIDSGESNTQNLTKFFYFCILYKNIYCIKSTIQLLDSLSHNAFNNMSAGIILRTVVSDLVLAMYIEKREKSKNINDVLQKIQYEHARHTSMHIGTYDIVFADKKDYQESKSNFAGASDKYLTPDRKLKLNLKNAEYIASIYKQIEFVFEIATPDEKKVIQSMFSSFETLSKMVHFGEMTMRPISEPFNAPNNLIGCHEMKAVIESCLEVCIGLLIKIDTSKTIDIDQLIKLLFECNAASLCD